MKWTGVASAILLIVACCMTWVVIPSQNIAISGIDTTGTSFGRPAYLHFAAILFFLLFTLKQKIWAKRSNLFVTAINMAWAIRNYFVVTMCGGGECPEKHIGIFLVLLASVLMLISSLFPDFKPSGKKLTH